MPMKTQSADVVVISLASLPVLGSPLPKESNYPNWFYCISVGRAEERGFLPSCRSTGRPDLRLQPGGSMSISGKNMSAMVWPMAPSYSPRPPARTGSWAPQHPLCASISSHLPWNHPQQEDSHPWGSRK